MRFGWLAAAAALVCSGQASAADFLTFTFTVDGTEDRVINQSGTRGNIYRSGPVIGPIVAVVPIAALGLSTYSYYNFSPAVSFYVEQFGLTATNTSLSFNESYGPYASGKADNHSVSLSLCGNFNSLIPGTSVAIDPACSTAQFFQGIFLGLDVGGDGSSFTGRVTSLTVAAGSGTPPAFGVINLPILPVPEPASWAMMIAGFGAISALARRRKGGVADRMLVG